MSFCCGHTGREIFVYQFYRDSLPWFEGNLFGLLWSMLTWLGWMLAHVCIGLNMLYLSCGIHHWSFVLGSFQFVDFCLCFIRVIYIVQLFFPLFLLIKVSSLNMWTSLYMKTSLYPESHILIMEIIELCVGPTRIWTSMDVSRSCENGNLQSLVDIV